MAQLTVCLAFLLCGAVIASHLSDDVLLRERRFAITSPKPFENCKSANFGKDYNTNKKCCNNEPVPFDKTTLETCNPKNKYGGDSAKYATEYLLHKLQDRDLGNKIEFNKDNSNKLAPAACLMDCLFKNAGLLFSNGTLNATAIKDYYIAKGPAEWKNSTIEALDMNCTAIAMDFKPTLITTVQNKVTHNCSSAPLILNQCVFFSYIGGCPKANIPAKPDTKNCAEGYKDKQNCDQLFPILTDQWDE